MSRALKTKNVIGGHMCGTTRRHAQSQSSKTGRSSFAIWHRQSKLHELESEEAKQLQQLRHQQHQHQEAEHHRMQAVTHPWAENAQEDSHWRNSWIQRYIFDICDLLYLHSNACVLNRLVLFLTFATWYSSIVMPVY